MFTHINSLQYFIVIKMLTHYCKINTNLLNICIPFIKIEYLSICLRPRCGLLQKHVEKPKNMSISPCPYY